MMMKALILIISLAMISNFLLINNVIKILFILEVILKNVNLGNVIDYRFGQLKFLFVH